MHLSLHMLIQAAARQHPPSGNPHSWPLPPDARRQ
jgi:hypothetical protein